MKHAKKLASLLLVLVMVFALTATAFAEGAEEGGGDDTPKGSITITDAVEGQQYTIYKILDLAAYTKIEDDENGAVTGVKDLVYKATDAWVSWLRTQKDYVSVDTQGYVAWKTGTDDDARIAAFAKAALEFAKQQNFVATQGPLSPTKGEDGTYSVTFSNLDLGYYLVDSTLGALCMLDTTALSVNIREKNAVPTNEKKVEEDSKVGTTTTDEEGNTIAVDPWDFTNDADIGQTVNFKSTIEIPVGSENIVFHDKMDDGFTLNQEKEESGDNYKYIKIYTDKDLKTELDTNNYTVTIIPTSDNKSSGSSTTGGPHDCTFEISFTAEYLKSLPVTTSAEDGAESGSDDNESTEDTTEDNGVTTLYVVYSATLNENAVVVKGKEKKGNENTSWVSYGDSTNTKTTPASTTTTYTWSLPVFKYAVKNGAEEALPNAEFELYTEEGYKNKNDQNDTAIYLVKETTAENSTETANSATVAANDTGDSGEEDTPTTPTTPTYVIYRVATATEITNKETSGANQTIQTDATGRFRIEGLDSGTYYLVETKAPAPYNVVPEPIVITIDKDGKINATTDDGGNTTGLDEIKVLNQDGTELPSTGGMGTTLFYVIGGILVVAAVVLLITKKRMSAEK